MTNSERLVHLQQTKSKKSEKSKQMQKAEHDAMFAGPVRVKKIRHKKTGKFIGACPNPGCNMMLGDFDQFGEKVTGCPRCGVTFRETVELVARDRIIMDRKMGLAKMNVVVQ